MKLREMCLLVLMAAVLPAVASADSPGWPIGVTWFDYQSHLSMGNRICVDEMGGRHFTWMRGWGSWPGYRNIWYAFLDEYDFNHPAPASDGSRDGSPTIGIFADGRAAISYHGHDENNGIRLAVDACRGCGLFTQSPVFEPDLNVFAGYPKVSFDRNDRLHLTFTVSGEFAGDPIWNLYTNSSDYGESWSEPAMIDSVDAIDSAVPTSSPVDSKVSLVYARPIDIEEANLYNNDIVYIESQNGVDWNFNDRINITNYQTDDTIRAFSDLDAVYDYDGDLHIVWVAAYYNADSGWVSTDLCFVFHWSEATGITLAYNAWYPSFPGVMNRSAAKLSIGMDDFDHLFVTWTHFDTLDVSAGGYSNGEIYMAYSQDEGLTWSAAVNLTNSPSPGCQPGDCDSDHWSSLAETVDEYLHIFYVNDKDAGGIPQSEGTPTENPMLYLKYPNPLFTGVDQNYESVPTDFYLFQNYPNPFNGRTEIKFYIPEVGEVRLEIFNLVGQKIATPIDERQEAGYKSVTWDASQYSSGIYFYKLAAGGKTFTRRMALVK